MGDVCCSLLLQVGNCDGGEVQIVLSVALGSTCCVSVTLVPARLDGKFLWAVRTCGAQTRMKCPDVFPGSFYTQTTTATAATTTSLCSDSRQQWRSQTTSDLCVWQPLTVCSTVVPIAGSPAGELSTREVSLLVLHKPLLGLCSSCHLETLALRPICEPCCRSLSVVTVPSNPARSGGSSCGEQTVQLPERSWYNHRQHGLRRRSGWRKRLVSGSLLD